MKTSRKQGGLTLVEIMVALAISSVLIAGVIQIFASNKATYRLQEGLSRMQENARFALDFMTRDIRQAGYIGCTRNLDSIQNALNAAPASFSPDSGIQGWEFSGTAPGSSYNLNATDTGPVETTGNSAGWNGWQTEGGDDALDSTPEAMGGSDILRVWHSAPGSANVTAISTGSPLTITVSNPGAIEAGDIVLLSDCVAADWLQICGTDNNDLTLGNGGSCGLGNQPGITPASLAAKAEIIPLVASTYFIGKRGGDRRNPPSLYYAGLNNTDNDGSTGRAEELVEGVESMQILYGEDTNDNGHANGFRTADEVSDWSKVTAVKIGLLMRTINEVDTQQHGGDYEVNGTSLNLENNDRRPRKVFSTTIQLRNRST